MKQGVDTERRQGYASELAGLWSGLSGTLTRLEAIAGEPPERLDEAALDSLPALQYALHRASEVTAGMAPPAGGETAHAALGAALADARDATGAVVDALATGRPEAAAALVHRWRGALFRVRLARHQLGVRQLPAAVSPAEPFHARGRAAAGAGLVAAGAFAFAAGALVAAWPLWAAGLALVAAGFLVYRQ